VYVWVDALINYWSALAFARPGEDLRPRFWPEVRHLLGKDILKFHCVIWPALLLAAGLEVPKQLFVHGYLLQDERKIAKSTGNVIDPLDLIDEYGVDPVRFWAARVVPFGQDGNVTLDSFRDRYEGELGNDLGNLLSRTTAMIARYRDGELR
ncbi:class I tRNA ligase family protein, partial [Actinomadura sp. DSM 109109]|nr:class I tRNA ligase family protein [Actinomadura lepetitiana]